MTTAEAPFSEIDERPPWTPWRGLAWPPRWLEGAGVVGPAVGASEEDTRLRIFFVMALFCAAETTLSIMALRASVRCPLPLVFGI